MGYLCLKTSGNAEEYIYIYIYIYNIYIYITQRNITILTRVSLFSFNRRKINLTFRLKEECIP